MSALEIPLIQSLLNIPIISRIRRNHGLEHATLHIISKRYPGRRMGGYSNARGFWLIGDIPTEAVQECVDEALRRLRNGEHNLAVHPNCGTNFAIAGTLAGIAGVIGMWRAGPRKRDKLERLPLVATLATLAIIVARPFGLAAQKHITTSGLQGGLEITEIIPKLKAHRIITRG
ncbi:MAG: DUF6391 domain-containing protein [Chloroflexota bacterium]|nr:DUF6391 domain-containing protein [Chloroflexota bacterium]